MTPEKLLATTMLVSLMFGAGLQVNFEHLLAVLKNYGLLARALLANFVLVPAAGYLLVNEFRLSGPIATGFMLMAIAPGVPFVVQSAGRAKGGSLGFAVSLAAILPALSILTIPITAALLLPGGVGALPAAQFITTLVLFQLAPLAIGIFVRSRFSDVAGKISRPVLLVFLATVLILLVFLVPKLIGDVTSVYGSRGMLASLCLVVLSIAFGWLLGGPERSFRRTLAIGTALRNVGLCTLIATTGFPGGLVASEVMSYLIIQFVVCTIVGVVLKRTAEPATPKTVTSA